MRLGIDVGASKIACGVVDKTGIIIGKSSIQLPSDTDIDTFLNLVLKSAISACGAARQELKDIDFIGCGCPGMIEDGYVITSPNLHYLDGFNLEAALSNIFSNHVLVSNDAKCAALGEYFFGSLKGTGNGLILTLGSGIGSAQIKNGKNINTAAVAKCEAGHMVIVQDGRQCGCGRRGCFERYASANALAVNACEELISEDCGILLSLCDGKPQDINAYMVVEAVKKGDLASIKAYERYLASLSTGIVNLYNILYPDIIVIGGGMSEIDDMTPIRVNELVRKEGCKVKIVSAALKNDAGIAGAAMLDIISGELFA